MKSAEDRARPDLAFRLDGSGTRRILHQAEVGPVVVVIVHIGAAEYLFRKIIFLVFWRIDSVVRRVQAAMLSRCVLMAHEVRRSFQSESGVSDVAVHLRVARIADGERYSRFSYSTGGADVGSVIMDSYTGSVVLAERMRSDWRKAIFKRVAAKLKSEWRNGSFPNVIEWTAK